MPEAPKRPFVYRQLYRCQSCGADSFIQSKELLHRFTCRSCKQKTGITQEPRRVFMRCQCGYRTSFWTNLTDELITIPCHGCGYPVDLEYNRPRGAYNPIPRDDDNDGQHRTGRK